MENAPKKLRGFAALKAKDPKIVSEIARKGGVAAHVSGTAHEWTSEAAREAGRKGGKKCNENRKRRLEPTGSGDAGALP